MKLIFTTILINIFFLSSVFGIEISKKEKSEIESLLEKQVEAWNEGNLGKFMETYWNSEELSFVGSRGPSYGWQQTFENYKKGYPDKAAMGKLTFDILKISKIDRKTIYVIGKFIVSRKTDDLSGHFTLVIQKIKGQWLIVSDHSSSSD